MSVSLTDLDLDLTFDENEDKEFGIPTIDGPLPTLESILNEVDNDSLSSDIELEVNETNESAATEALDSLEKSSLSSFGSKGVKRSSITENSSHHKFCDQPFDGSLIRHSVLKSLSGQIKSANSDRINGGKPTALTVSNLYVIVGTSHGFVLVFDLRQVMKSCLRISEDTGAVSAMSVKRDSSRLLCGYSMGSVALWDLSSGELLKVYNNLHTQSITVLHLKFMSDENFGALSDSSGSVFVLDFRRKDIDSQCIFTGSRGEVLNIEPLILAVPTKKEISNFKNICLLSMATVTKVIVLTLRPSIVVQFTHPLKGDVDTLPLLCWQFVVVQISADTRVIDPVLAFARQKTIYFFQASYKSSSKIVFTPLMQITVEYIIQSLNWLNSRTISTIDNLERMHILDVRSEKELEVIDIGKVQMVYSTAIFKALDNDLHVSGAMSAGAERACYHSICTTNHTLLNNISANLLVLGVNSVHLFAIRHWTDRIDNLVKDKRFVDAMALTLSFYGNTAKAVIGLTGKKSEKRKIVAQKMAEVMNDYIDYEQSLYLQSDIEANNVIPDSYRQLIHKVVQYCLAIEENHHLLDDLYERFSDLKQTKHEFIRALDSFALKGSVTKLSPTLAKDLISYYEELKYMANIETVVTHLDISSLDIHYVMTLCQKYSLFDAMIHIHINAFDDHLTPFDQLIQRTRWALNRESELTESETELADKLLLYISALLRGLSYPFLKELEANKKERVIKQILSRVMTPTNTNEFGSDSQRVIYPNLKTLLAFDVKRFLNVIANAFETFDTENTFLMAKKQQMIDILVEVMSEPNHTFNDQQKGAILLFIAKQLSNRKNEISITRELFDQILQYLLNGSESLWFDERQLILLELIQSRTELTLSEEQLILRAKEVKFYKVCEYIYLKNRSWGQIIWCYICDRHRKTHVFDFIHQILLSHNVSEDEKKNFKEHVYSNIESLTQIDNRKSAKLILDHLDVERFDEIVSCLKSNPKVLYKLLSGVLTDTNKGHKRDPSTGSISYESLSLREQKKHSILSDAKTQEMFIELMAEFEPNKVYQTLTALEDYRPEVVLTAIQNFCINDATAFLLEKTSRFNEAFHLLNKQLESSVQELNDSDLKSSWNSISCQVVSVIDFCRRCSTKTIDTKEKELFWFTLLESVLRLRQVIKSRAESDSMADKLIEETNNLMNRSIESMKDAINLTPVIESILSKGSLDGDKQRANDLINLIRIVTENYEYEQTVLQTTNNLLLSELHLHLAHLRRDVNKAKPNRNQWCLLCATPLTREPVILFNCMHSFHYKCVTKRVTPPKCLSCDSPQEMTEDQSLIFLNISDESDGQSEQKTIDSNERLRTALNLSETQFKALERLRSDQRIDSKARILNLLPNTGIRLSSNESFRDDIFRLNLAPDWRKVIETKSNR